MDLAVACSQFQQRECPLAILRRLLISMLMFKAFRLFIEGISGLTICSDGELILGKTLIVFSQRMERTAVGGEQDRRGLRILFR